MQNSFHFPGGWVRFDLVWFPDDYGAYILSWIHHDCANLTRLLVLISMYS